MSAADLARLLELQAIDTKVDQLNHREATHPLRADLQAAEKAVLAQGKVQAEIETRHHDIHRQQKRADDEVVTVRTKRDETEARMYDGSVTGIKELQAMQDESKHLLARQTELEDAELVIMEALEVVSTERDAAAAAHDVLTQKQRDVEAALTEALAEVIAERTDVEGTREAAASGIPADLLAIYEKLRVDLGGVAAAKLTGDTCQGCFLNLSAVTVDQIRKSADGEVVNCDQCGRILIR